MLRGIAIGILSVLVVGTGYWGYKEHQEKNAILIHAENNYQRAFHDLTYQIDLLHDKIGTSLAMNSKTSLSPTLLEVWQIASNAQTGVGQLPLTLIPFNKTEEFLTNISEFSYKTAVRDLEKEPLTDQEYKTLKELYAYAKDIQDELRNVQNKVLEHNLRWMDVQMAIAAEDSAQDNTIIDGFKTVEKNAEHYAEIDFGPTMTALKDTSEDNFKYLEGKNLSKQEAQKKALQFLDIKENVDVEITENGEEASDAFYSLVIDNPSQNATVFMDITKKGGYPIWVLHDRVIEEQKISVNEASEKAARYLKQHNFDNLELFESSQYDNIGVFTFLGTEQGVKLYPDAIHIKVALDNGDIIGLSAREYLTSHHKRSLPKAAISKEEALQKINKEVKVMETGLALITNNVSEEALCYEILGTLDDETYRIFINAIDGTEEKVEKIQSTERIFDEV